MRKSTILFPQRSASKASNRMDRVLSRGILHGHEAAPLHADLNHAQQRCAASRAGDVATAGHVMLARGQSDDVGDGRDAGKRAQQNPPRGKAGGGAIGDDFVMLR